MDWTREPAAWAHLGDCLRAERDGRTIAEVARESGVSVRQIVAYEAGTIHRKGPPDKMWQLMNYYGWTPDSPRRILAGGLPAYLPEAKPIPPLRADEWEIIRAGVLDAADLSARRKRQVLKLLSEGGILPPAAVEHQP